MDTINLTQILQSLNLNTEYFNLEDYIDSLENITKSELQDAIDCAISEVDVIHYDIAMNYLSEHDFSLTESLKLANALGYTALNINSELLATLHLQDKLRTEYNDAIDDILSGIISTVNDNDVA